MNRKVKNLHLSQSGRLFHRGRQRCSFGIYLEHLVLKHKQTKIKKREREMEMRRKKSALLSVRCWNHSFASHWPRVLSSSNLLPWDTGSDLTQREARLQPNCQKQLLEFATHTHNPWVRGGVTHPFTDQTQPYLTRELWQKSQPEVM